MMQAEQPLLYDHYEVGRVLGKGAMGVVYLARDVRIGRQVALKTLQLKHTAYDEDDGRVAFDRFRREAELCGSLLHQNIVTLYEVGYENKRFTYLAMEYVEGESLLALLRRERRLSVPLALTIADGVLQGLAFAHERGVIHRDVKPANILVGTDGVAKIADFGIARSLRTSAELTDGRQLLGTPFYMSPEQIAGREFDARSDLFSVGVVLFETLSGRKPFDGVTITDVLFNIVHEPTPDISAIVPTLPPWCVQLVETLLAKNAADRFESAAAASAELRSLLQINGMGSVLPIEPLRMAISLENPAEDTPTTPLEIPEFRQKSTPGPKWTVPRSIAWSIIALLTLGAVGVSLSIVRKIDERPTSVITVQQLSELEAKKILLNEADVLYRAGAFQAAYQKYNEYLHRYPTSRRALQGREKALSAHTASLDHQDGESQSEQSVRSARPSATRRATAPAAKPSGDSEADASQPGLWTRVKRFFRGGSGSR